MIVYESSVINTRMDIDRKFRTYICKHLNPRAYDRLVRECERYHNTTCLASMSVEIIPENILNMVEEFLADLPFERAQEYVGMRNVHGVSLIFYCVDINLIARIIKYVPDINIRNEYGSSVLMYACGKSTPLNLNIIKFLLDHGADVNATNGIGTTALMWLCVHPTDENIEQVIELLIFRGADPLAKNSNGLMAYDLACVYNESALSERLSQLLQGKIKMNNTKRAS